MDPDGLTLERGLALLSLPRVIGIHPETQEEITAAIGRFGPYVKMGNLFKSLDPDDDVLVVGLNRAMALLADVKPRGRGLGEHPSGGAVEVRRGRFGPFVLHGSRVASLPRSMDFDGVTLEEAVKLLAEKGKDLPPRGGKGAKGKAKPARKAAAKAPDGEDATPAARAPAGAAKSRATAADGEAAKAKAPAAAKAAPKGATAAKPPAGKVAAAKAPAAKASASKPTAKAPPTKPAAKAAPAKKPSAAKAAVTKPATRSAAAPPAATRRPPARRAG
jgi:DNA topoisomerase-1